MLSPGVVQVAVMTFPQDLDIKVISTDSVLLDFEPDIWDFLEIRVLDQREVHY